MKRNSAELDAWRREGKAMGSQTVAAGDQRISVLSNGSLDNLSPKSFACLHELIEDQAERTPNATAVIYEDRRLTYKELSLRADCVASQLKEMGAGRGTLVGLFVERSVEIVIGILGILKSGAAYVPVDSTFPMDRSF